MSYVVKEIFYTLQGEGANAGRPAVFCRFAGCNLWSGAEADRASAQCRYCDTQFVGTDGEGGGTFVHATELARAIADRWPLKRSASQSTIQNPKSEIRNAPLVVLTGGEPLLQLDTALIDALHAAGFTIAIETNGTMAVPAGVDWVCVSPKAGAPLIQRSGQELKLVFPQPGADPAEYETLVFDRFFLQPMDGPDRDANTQAAVEYCLAHPRWRLSLQIHKILGIR